MASTVSNLNFLIADDEELSRNYLAALIHDYCPECSIVASVNNISKAREVIAANKIDIVFLDILMPGGNGFELLSSFKYNRNFQVVFVTAYNQYAIQAIREQAFDYLLKPIDKDDFLCAITRIKHQPVSETAKRVGNPGDIYLSQKLSIHHQNGFKVVALKDISYLEAANNYTLIKLLSGESIIVSRPLKHFEKELDPSWFFRIHKSYIINTSYISEFVSRDGGYILMQSGEKIYVSRYKLSAFFDVMTRLTNGFKA